MRRRTFLAGVSAWPVGAAAQVADLPPRVVVLADSEEFGGGGRASIERLRLGLYDLGWIDGRNIELDIIYAGANPRHFRRSVEEGLAKPADLVWVNNNALLEEVRRVAGDRLPVVFVTIVDPVRLGYVESLARPGANITGFMFWDITLLGKLVQLLREAAPAVQQAKIVYNPDISPFYPRLLNEARALAASPIPLSAVPLRELSAIERTMREIAARPGSGLILPTDPFIHDQKTTIATWATAVGLPLISMHPATTSWGSLMGYGPDMSDVQRSSAGYVDRILRGANPRDLPVQTPTRYEFAINLVVARRLGLRIPDTLFARADAVVE